MNLRLVTTPIAADVPRPVPRGGGLAASLLPAFHASGVAESQLPRLAEPDALVVTTGQQPGLFTGPLYTVFKALSAAALARRLEEEWDRPVVPVFWAAGDDHDFAEANHASWIAQNGELRTAVLRERPAGAPLTPMYREPLGEEIAALLAQLEDDLMPSEYGSVTAEWLRRSFRADATVAGAYREALTELLGAAGIVVFESTHRAVKHSAASHLLRALEASDELDRGLAARAAELREAGRDPGVAVGDGATLLMLEASEGRDRLLATGDRTYVTRRSGERFSLAALEAISEKEPERLSPNVLLRPVIESALLPTVAYVAGPGELRYLALTPPIYDRIDVRQQTPVPRWSGVIVEPRVDRVLAKFGVTLDQLLDPAADVERTVVREQLPAEASETLAALRRQIADGYGRIAGVAQDVDSTLVRSVEGTRNRALAGVRDVEKRLVRHLRRRRGTELRQLTEARTLLLPQGQPQERVLTIAPFLARHGPPLIPALLAEASAWYAGALEGEPVRE